MREIKFRGRDGDDWYYGSLFVNSVGQTAICAPKSWWMKPVKAETVGEYTGLNDSNGKEIYEGDIVKATLKDKSFVKRFHMDETIIGKISFDGAWWLGEWNALWRLLRYYDLTVIGNIYDNPERLEVKCDA